MQRPACLWLLLLLGMLIGSTALRGQSVESFDVCRDPLTDRQYLEHMIPHHQVAIDVSVEHAKHTTNDALAPVLRALVWTQTYEVALMKEVLLKPFSRNVSEMAPGVSRGFMEATFSRVPPNTLALSTSACDPNFFDPVAHAAHMKHMGKVTDEMYLDHMIPHHQVAVDMSKVLLKHTTNDFMSHLAYRIIRAQEAEIKLLHDLRQRPMWARPTAVQNGLL
jgi:uncharacterized protein (DUF305 family)